MTAACVTKSDLILRPDPGRTVIRPFWADYPAPFAVPGRPRAREVVDRVLALPDDRLDEDYARVTGALDSRHRDVEPLLLRRFGEVADRLGGLPDIDGERQRLIGAYFSEEYSFEAAALFNPSIVAAPDQSGAPEGSVSFVLSLRGIGEGHVSSVTFRTGHWSPEAGFSVDPASPTAVPPRIDPPDAATSDSGGLVTLRCGGSRDPSETVLFPVLPRQRQGIEDLRMVTFIEEDGTVRRYGTYTAFSGAAARSELLTILDDFDLFEMRPLAGDVGATKGMALFPRRVGGRYAMLGRQDNESIWFVQSDDLYTWNGGAKLVSPRYSWEFIQMGNCGSPIELDEGWLVLTHGVGTVRTYCMGACLLDKRDPGKLLARIREPLIEPTPEERDGYVPNVVYACGSLLHGRTLLLPYGVADNFATFASVDVDGLLALMD